MKAIADSYDSQSDEDVLGEIETAIVKRIEIEGVTANEASKVQKASN